MNAPAFETLTAPLLTRQDRDGVVTLSLNRPQQFNALSEESLGALQIELDALTQAGT